MGTRSGVGGGVGSDVGSGAGAGGQGGLGGIPMIIVAKSYVVADGGDGFGKESRALERETRCWGRSLEVGSGQQG